MKKLARNLQYAGLIFGLFIFTFICGPYLVSTASMAPTVHIPTFIIINKIAYGLRIPFTSYMLAARSPRRGDIVMFMTVDNILTPYLKRVIGKPGDMIRMEQDRVYVNGVLLEVNTLPPQPTSAYNSRYPQEDSFVMLKQETTEDSERYYVQYKANITRAKNVIYIRVPYGHCFLLGDNRDNSSDSREFGFVPLKDILGKCIFSQKRIINSNE
jgi:signal peptidase I